ncbi:MAG: translation initiation factor eIF-6, partial [Thermoprotei archaeon]
PLSFKTYENALGNILLVNDKVVLIHSDLAKRNKVVLKKIEDVLDVEVIDYNFSFPIMGTVAVANNRGVLTHPSLKDEELEFIKNTLGLRVGKGTVNMGSPYVRSGLIVNSHGFLAGLKTSGLEMQRIYEILIS